MEKIKKYSLIAVLSVLCALMLAACDGFGGKTVVTFMSDGVAYTTVEIKPDAVMPDDPVKEGFVFDGWYIDDGVFMQEFGGFAGIFVNMTVYAKWVDDAALPQATLVTFMSDGAVYAAVEIKPDAVMPKNPAKDGFVFGGWYLDEAELTQKFTGLTEAATSVTVFGKWTATTAGLAYALIDGAYRVQGLGSAKDTEIVIPETYEGKPVNSIGASAFSGRDFLTGITIPGSVVTIGERAFYNCSSLERLILPPRLAKIGQSAFLDCVGLTEIVVEQGNDTYKSEGNCLIEIATSTLILGCRTSVIPAGVTSIGNSAFAYCSSLTSIVIPKSVTSIQGSAFAGCSGLTSIDIPDGVTQIGGWAFWNCAGLISVTLPDSVTSIHDTVFSKTGIWANAPDNSAVYVGKWAVGNKGTLTGTLSLREDTVGIARAAFADCSKLTGITIPEGVKYIEDNAFRGCNGVRNISFNAVECADLQLDNGVFYNAGTGGSGLTVTFGANVPQVPEYLFYPRVGEGAPNLSRITFDTESICTRIGKSAFSNCITLKEVTLPTSVTDIGPFAFFTCRGLTRVRVAAGSKLTNIGSGAFYGCRNLSDITLPDNVAHIGEYAFFDCGELSAVHYGGTNLTAWSRIIIDNPATNIPLTDAARYYYSAIAPATSGNYWRYTDNGVPAVWE